MKKSFLFIGATAILSVSSATFAATPIQLMQCEINTYNSMIGLVAEAAGIQPQDGQSLDEYAKYAGKAQALIGSNEALGKSVRETCVKLFNAAESVK